MKKILFMILCIPVLAIFSGTSCVTQKDSPEPQEILAEQPAPRPMSHSFLGETDVGSTVTVFGTLHGSKEKGFYVKENPESKGTVTFILVLSESLEGEAALLVGNALKVPVTVTGILLKADSPWKKTIQVTTIMESTRG